MLARRERHRMGIPRPNNPDSDWVGIIFALALLAGWGAFLQALSTRDISIPRDPYYESNPVNRQPQYSVSPPDYDASKDKFVKRLNAEGHIITVSLATGETISVKVTTSTGSTASAGVEKNKEDNVEAKTDLPGGSTKDETTTVKKADDTSTTGSDPDAESPVATMSSFGATEPAESSTLSETQSLPVTTSQSTLTAEVTGTTAASSTLTSVPTGSTVTEAGTTAASTTTSTVTSGQSSSSSSPQTQGPATTSTGSSATTTEYDGVEVTGTDSTLEATTGSTSGDTESSPRSTTTSMTQQPESSTATTTTSTSAAQPTSTSIEDDILGYLMVGGDKIRIPKTGLVRVNIKFPPGSKVSITVLAGCRISMSWTKGADRDMILYENRENPDEATSQVQDYDGFYTATGRCE